MRGTHANHPQVLIEARKATASNGLHRAAAGPRARDGHSAAHTSTTREGDHMSEQDDASNKRWPLVIAGGVVMGAALGVRHVQGLFLMPVTIDHGWSRETV